MERRLLIGFLIAPLFVVGAALLTDHAISSHAAVTWQILLVSVVMYPVCEEIIFRGFIQGELGKRQFAKKSYAGISLANVLASTIFAMAHVLVFQNAYALLAFFPGLIFGYFFERHRSLLLPIVLHSVYNFAGLFGPSIW